MNVCVRKRYIIPLRNVYVSPVADPGFSVGGGGGGGGGADLLGGGGAPTSDAYTFWQKHIRKRKKLILLGGGHVPAAPPWICQWSLCIHERVYFYIINICILHNYINFIFNNKYIFCKYHIKDKTLRTFFYIVCSAPSDTFNVSVSSVAK